MERTTKRLTIFVMVLTVLSAGLLGINTMASALASSNEKSPVGVWEIQYQDAVGQRYLDILDLRPDGTYTRHASDGSNDRGTYETEGNVMAFQSRVDPSYSNNLLFELLGGKELKFIIPSANLIEVVWNRSVRQPNFRTKSIDDRDIPKDLPELIAAAYENIAYPWKSDALPTWAQIESQKHGHFQITLHFFSQVAGKEMQVRLSAYHLNVSIHDGSRARNRPLQLDLLDLPHAVDLSKSYGISGPMKKASITAYEKFGPVWRLTQEGPAVVTISAVTGDQIHEDVTGYIEQYEADWAYAGELWRLAMEQYKQEEDFDDSLFDDDHPMGYGDQGGCESAGFEWDGNYCGYK